LGYYQNVSNIKLLTTDSFQDGVMLKNVISQYMEIWSLCSWQLQHRLKLFPITLSSVQSNCSILSKACIHTKRMCRYSSLHIQWTRGERDKSDHIY